MSSKVYTIRQARIYDVPAIVRLEQETSRTPWSAASITEDVTKNTRAYVAVAVIPAQDGSGFDEVIGYADIWIVAGEAQLNNIAVDERYRGHHIGETLLMYMIQKSREFGCRVMTLEVRRGNTAAASLYDKLGFRRVGVRPRYYKDNHEDAVLMDRNIGDLEVEYSVSSDDAAERDADSGISIDVDIQ